MRGNHKGGRLAPTLFLSLGAILLQNACTPSGSIGPDPCAVPGTICTVAGTGLSAFDGDGRGALKTSFYHPLDIDFDLKGRPLILDFNNLRIRRLNEDSTIETVMGLDYEASPVEGALAIETTLHHASDISMDREGRYFVAGNHAPVVFLVDTANRVHVLAGNGDFGEDGDGGPAIQARFFAPFGVLPDERGGFYVSDIEAHAVRYVDSDGIIHAVAGNGTAGYSGDGGMGRGAQLRSPTRMALDDQGRLYICDTDNHAVRRINADASIETIAGGGELGYSGDGGPATEAELNTPYDLRFSPAGDLYIADTGNNVIRRIRVDDGIIETVVGSGQPGFAGDGEGADRCQLDRPSGINFSPDGAMWIADTYNQRVRRVAGFLTASSLVARP